MKQLVHQMLSRQICEMAAGTVRKTAVWYCETAFCSMATFMHGPLVDTLTSSVMITG